jgi:hypothetical protein
MRFIIKKNRFRYSRDNFYNLYSFWNVSTTEVNLKNKFRMIQFRFYRNIV